MSESTQKQSIIASPKLAEYSTYQRLSVKEAIYIGKVMAQSGLFTDIDGAAQAVTKILAGQEMGIPPFTAMTGIHIIKGKATLGGHLMAMKVKSSGKYDYIVKSWDNEKCIIDFYELNGKKTKIGTSEFTIEDARKAGLVKADSGWVKYPRNMLFNRAISAGVRTYTPDVLSVAAYTPDELGADVNEDGDVLKLPTGDVEVKETETKPTEASYEPQGAAVETSDDSDVEIVEEKPADVLPTDEDMEKEPDFEPEVDQQFKDDVEAKFTELGIKAQDKMRMCKEVCGSPVPTEDGHWRAVDAKLNELAKVKM